MKQLRLAALADEPTAFGTEYAAAAALTDDVWRERLLPERFPTFVWETDGDAAGMVVGMTDLADPGAAYLVAMWVRPESRGQGVADALVTAVLDWARSRGAPLVRLRVTGGNDRAERLYARHGFARTGRADERERDGLTEFEMAVTL